MRRVLIAAALAATAVSAPAMAQWSGPAYGSGYGYGRGYSDSIDQQIRRIRIEIQTAADRDRITEWREQRLLRQLDQITRDYNRARWGGFDPGERREIYQRLSDIRRQIWQPRSWNGNQSWSQDQEDYRSGSRYDRRHYDPGDDDNDDDD